MNTSICVSHLAGPRQLVCAVLLACCLAGCGQAPPADLADSSTSTSSFEAEPAPTIEEIDASVRELIPETASEPDTSTAPEPTAVVIQQTPVVVPPATQPSQTVAANSGHDEVDISSLEPGVYSVGSPQEERRQFLRAEISRLRQAIQSDEELMNRQGWGETLTPLLGSLLAAAVQNSNNDFDRKMAPVAAPALEIGGEVAGREISKAKQSTAARLDQNRSLLRQYEYELQQLQ
ncbi:hypothetical protein Mal4_18650 [Maioricimonas rarisocia]|uniref:Uncharacterized protein n=1 Tax=Maioricimonas rarisocia TaxID=2528026 RepID=A0A517Z4Y4_9PLAN|nr:hypothetical protein [Maioricimonas rarisocia]QDU37551.1 hypothetical protein Mal4_18650 [Maioricimonas rarisocia]